MMIRRRIANFPYCYTTLHSGPQPPSQHPLTSSNHHIPDDQSIQSMFLYLASAGLVLGSIYYTKYKSNEVLLPLDKDSNRMFPSRNSTMQQTQNINPLNLFSINSKQGTITTWIAQLKNLWTYPSSVRTPLRTALIYHRVFPDAQKAETSYLSAYQNAKDLGLLHIQLGIQFELAQFYADQSLPIPCINWYQNGLVNLVSWYKNQETTLKKPMGPDQIMHVGTVLAHMARAKAYLDTHPESGIVQTHVPGTEPLPVQSVDRYYSMALAAMLLSGRLDQLGIHRGSFVDQIMDDILHNRIPSVPEPAHVDSNKKLVSISNSPIVSLLEEMATYYTTQSQSTYAATLRRFMIPYMIPISDNIKDIYCRTGLVYNNLANDLVTIAASSPNHQKHVLWNEAFQLLTQAQESTNVKTSDECAECLAVSFKNLGHVAYLLGKPDLASKYLTDSISIARQVGLVDVRRDAQAELNAVKQADKSVK